MLKELDKFISDQPPIRLSTFALFLVAVIGVVDHLTGNELSFSIFYLVPVGFGSWYLGARFGFVICFVSAITWFGIEYTSGRYFSDSGIPYWNAFVRMGFFIIVSVLIERLQRALELQESLAQSDGLTGLLNARTFKQRCGSQFGLASRNERPLALGYIDLDGFKGINDRLGHSVGDLVLKAVADILTRRLRSSDISARLGGDEFSILLPETDLSGAQIFFAGLHENLLELVNINHWPVGFSIGVAVFYSHQESVDAAIQHADALMYKVKNSGKNRILFEEYK